MAETDISGFDGDVTMPAAHGGEAFSWSIRSASAVKNVSRYGGSRFAKKRLGMIEPTGHIDLYLRQGATGTAPGLFDTAVDGSALTLQASDGCTYAGSAVFTNGAINHSFADPAVPLGWDWEGTGDWAEVWEEGA